MLRSAQRQPRCGTSGRYRARNSARHPNTRSPYDGRFKTTESRRAYLGRMGCMEIRRQYSASGMGTVAGPPDPRDSYVSPPELAILRAMLADAWGRNPRCVLVQGERGIGKTALLRHLAADLNDTRVLWASGEGSEAQLRYGLVDHLARSAGEMLPEEARRAVGREQARTRAVCDRQHAVATPGDLGDAHARAAVDRRHRPRRHLLADSAALRVAAAARQPDPHGAGGQRARPPHRGVAKALRQRAGRDGHAQRVGA